MPSTSCRRSGSILFAQPAPQLPAVNYFTYTRPLFGIWGSGRIQVQASFSRPKADGSLAPLVTNICDITDAIQPGDIEPAVLFCSLPALLCIASVAVYTIQAHHLPPWLRQVSRDLLALLLLSC